MQLLKDERLRARTGAALKRIFSCSHRRHREKEISALVEIATKLGMIPIFQRTTMAIKLTMYTRIRKGSQRST